jgi:hypothetical protein
LLGIAGDQQPKGDDSKQTKLGEPAGQSEHGVWQLQQQVTNTEMVKTEVTNTKMTNPKMTKTGARVAF